VLEVETDGKLYSKGNGTFLYSAVSSPCQTVKALYTSPLERPVYSNTKSISLGRMHVGMLQILHEDYSLT